MAERGFFTRMVPLAAALGLAGAVVLAPAGMAGAAGAAPYSPERHPTAASRLDWTQFLHDTQHSSMSPATAFTTANAASATEVWHWQPPVVVGQPAPLLDASPTVVAGTVYIGAESGEFYALDEATGAVEWNTLLDTEPVADCVGPGARYGISSTAAVLPDPVTGALTVYVSGARYLYALNAATGAVIWKTEIGPPDPSNPNGYYNWSSPTVVGGHIYAGVASGCDVPLIRGGVVELDQHTGTVLNTFYAVPAGSTGGSVWSTVAASASGNGLWVSTGNECSLPRETDCPPGSKIGHSLSILHLSSSLTLLQAWRAPNTVHHNWDFGSSPTLFGTGMPPSEVGACNKDGLYYTVTAHPEGTSTVWTDDIGTPAGARGECLASAVWDGSDGALYLAGNATTIGGTHYRGSVSQVNPQTGAYIWRTGLPCTELGTPTLDSAGVLAATTHGGCATGASTGAYLLDASTGAILETLPTGASHIFAQPVFAQGTLFVATEGDGLYNFAP